MLPFSVNIDTKQIEMSLRSDDPRACANITTKDLKPGQKLSGTIRRVEEYGLFIQIDNSKLSGLCHKSEVWVAVLFNRFRMVIGSCLFSLPTTPMPMSLLPCAVSAKEIKSKHISYPLTTGGFP